MIAFGVNDDGDLEPIEDASALGSVSSFLPLLEERSGAKFLIQSDFLVQPGREAIQYELAWNQWLVGDAAELAKSAIEEFKQHDRWKSQFLSTFQFQQYRGQPAFDKLFYPKLQQPLIAHLEQSPVYSTAHRGFVKPEFAVVRETEMTTLVDDSDLPTLFPGRTDLRFADPKVDSKLVPQQIQSKTQRLGWGQIGRNKQLMESKLKQPNHPDWFVKLYQAMANTEQYFKLETYQTSRSKYSSYEAPIYVLTDRNVIVPANKASLPDVAAEVVELRKQYPEVDRLLGFFHLLHPALVTPELTQFFKERTHVQAFDYTKICRDAFLPAISVLTDKPTPSKDELIAYTRLLQNGPSVEGRIWVLTEKGPTIPSDQVFLGTAYSPSEDWERNKQYVPHMDFLSEESLVGAAQADVPKWKAFFQQFRVKDAGQRVDTELFAKAYTKDELKELHNYVDKDRKQYAYDLEAVRMVDNVIVKLEVKGQKREGPVELAGNEPEATKQSKMKGEPFWLCIVPGIPETPVLWVVEDVITAGTSHTLTVEIARWKSLGRRVN